MPGNALATRGLTAGAGADAIAGPVKAEALPAAALGSSRLDELRQRPLLGDSGGGGTAEDDEEDGLTGGSASTRCTAASRVDVSALGWKTYGDDMLAPVEAEASPVASSGCGAFRAAAMREINASAAAPRIGAEVSSMRAFALDGSTTGSGTTGPGGTAGFIG